MHTVTKVYLSFIMPICCITFSDKETSLVSMIDLHYFSLAYIYYLCEGAYPELEAIA